MIGKKLRAAVLTLVFSIALVPVAAARPATRDTEPPTLRREIVRIINIIKKTFGGAVSNADSLAPPRP